MKHFVVLGILAGISVFGAFTASAHAETNPKILIEKPIIGTVFEIQSDVTISGSATANSDIVISTKEGEYARLKSDDKGKWSYTIPTVSEGAHTIEAKVIQKIDALSEKTAVAYVTYNVSPPPAPTVQRLAETGILAIVLLPIGIMMLVITTWLYIDYRRHKKPLKKVDPKIKYSFWHHLHVVSFPLIKYRLSINVDRRIPDRSVNIRRY